MLPTRALGWTFLAAAAVGLVATTSPAQDDGPLSGVIRQAATDYKNADKKLDAASEAKAKATLDELSKYFVGRISSPKLYKSIQEFKSGKHPIDTLYDDLDRFLIVPTPKDKFIPENVNYLRDFGQSIDTAAKAAIIGSADPIVRLNAARMLAHAAKTGAPAHAKTIRELLENPATQPDVRHYALKAAENFFSAYDILKMFAGTDVRKHSVPEADLIPLIAAVEANVTDTKILLNLPMDADLKALTEDQKAVAHFVRRQAIRALGQLRFASFELKDGKVVTPAYTLARVAAGDPSIVPAPSNTEVAEAVIGMGNMAFAGEYQLDVAVDAAATGILNFTKSGLTTDKTTPWKLYAARMSAALANWKAITKDLAPTRRPQAIADLAAAADKEVLLPLIQNGSAARPTLPEFKSWRDTARAKSAADGRTTLYRNLPNTTVNWGQ